MPRKNICHSNFNAKANREKPYVALAKATAIVVCLGKLQ